MFLMSLGFVKVNCLGKVVQNLDFVFKSFCWREEQNRIEDILEVLRFSRKAGT